jgi:hypothetical protein
MADSPLLARATALLVGPYLMGKRALSLAFTPDQDAPLEAPPQEAPLRLSITPPEHAIKRRG